MKKNVLFLGMLALVFGFVLAGCASGPKIDKNTSIPIEERCQLYIGVNRVVKFDNTSVYWEDHRIMNIPIGTHTVTCQDKITDYNGSYYITTTTTWDVTYDFKEAGRMYIISPRLDSNKQLTGHIEDWGFATWAIPKVDKKNIGENESLFVVKYKGAPLYMKIFSWGLIHDTEIHRVLKINGKSFVAIVEGGTCEFVLPNGTYDFSFQTHLGGEGRTVQINATTSSLVTWNMGDAEANIKPLK
jgi:hypothetical protein